MRRNELIDELTKCQNAITDIQIQLDLYPNGEEDWKKRAKVAKMKYGQRCRELNAELSKMKVDMAHLRRFYYTAQEVLKIEDLERIESAMEEV